MTTDLIARINQLQQELDEAQQIANNNYRLYTTAKAQRDDVLTSLKECEDVLGDPDVPRIFALHVLSLALDTIARIKD